MFPYTDSFHYLPMHIRIPIKKLIGSIIISRDSHQVSRMPNGVNVPIIKPTIADAAWHRQLITALKRMLAVVAAARVVGTCTP